MTSGHLVALLANLRRLASVRETAALSDGHLVERYLLCRDESAFAALVQRHGGMVWNVCRRVLVEDADADADDAFQATFLVLLHKAKMLRGQTSLAGWLQGVAWRLARKLKAETTRRRLKERCVETTLAVDAMKEVEQRDLRALLDAELERLPEKYRLPLVLCYLEGKTYAEAARQLGWKEGTVCGRLARAREQLRQRLSRRGVTLSGAALLAALTEPASVPAATVAAVVRMAALFALGQTAGNGTVAALAQSILQGMTVAKLKTMAVLVAVLGVCAAGAGWTAHWVLAKKPSETEPPRRVPLAEAVPPARLDRFGDPLPPEAIARLGTIRFRHGGNVFAVAFAADDKCLLSADCFGVRLWHTATGKPIRSIGQFFNTSLRGLALAPDGKSAALAEHHRGTIQIHDIASGKLLHQFVNGNDNDDRFCSVLFSPNSKILASYAGKIIRLWNPATGERIHQWTADAEGVHAVVFSPDGKLLLSGGDDRTIHFWDTATGKEVRRIKDHPGPILRLALSPDGKLLASLGSTKQEFKTATGSAILCQTDNKIHLWDAESGRKRQPLEAAALEKPKKPVPFDHPQAVHAMIFAPDGKTVAAAVGDGTVRLWDAATGAERRHWQAEGATVLAFSSDGKLLAGGDNDNTVRLWDAATGRERNPFAGHRGSIRYWVLSADGRRAASSGSDRTVRIWDANEGRELHRLDAPEGDMRPIALSATAERLTTLGASIRQSGADNKARLWDVANGRETHAFALPVEDKLVFVSPDGRLCAVHDGKEIAFWDLTAGSKRTARIAVSASVYDCRFTSDNRSLIGWTEDQTVYVWDVATGRERRRFSAGEKGDRPCIALSSDGRCLAFADNKGILSLYDVADGKEVRRIKGVPPFLSSLAFSPDGRTVVGGGRYDPTLYLWETATGLLRHRLRGHEGRIVALIFSADGNRLLSGNEDKR